MANEFYLSTDFAVANSKEPINQQIYKFLKKAIIECRLMPDDPLSENEVSSKFKYKISRQPVREALIKLAENDFVVIQPKKTTKVSRISRADILQGSIIREALECHIIKIAAANITDEQLESLKSNVEMQCKIAENYDLQEHFQLDDEFHISILNAAGMHKAWNMIESVKGVMDRLRYISLEKELIPITVTSEAHLKIYEQLKKHDAEGAACAMRQHVVETRTSLQGIISKCNQNWFTD